MLAPKILFYMTVEDESAAGSIAKILKYKDRFGKE